MKKIALTILIAIIGASNAQTRLYEPFIDNLGYRALMSGGYIPTVDYWHIMVMVLTQYYASYDPLNCGSLPSTAILEDILDDGPPYLISCYSYKGRIRHVLNRQVVDAFRNIPSKWVVLQEPTYYEDINVTIESYYFRFTNDIITLYTYPSEVIWVVYPWTGY